MATLTPSLSLVANASTATSAPGLSSDAISFTLTDTLTTTNPSGSISRAFVADGAAHNIVKADATAGTGTNGAAVGYVFIHIVSTAATDDFVDVEIQGATDIPMFAGEFLFMPTAAGRTIIATPSGGTATIEHAFWTKG
tara:strand:- start:143 stop:559 length:417 start_codon:yes stop_codon:yes gene_type:complete